jgi:peptide/nickel transport system permease protein
MGIYLLKRFFILLLTLILVSIAIFAVLMIIPSDPAQIILGIHATPETLQTLRHKLGLDRPVLIQYLSYMKNLVVGDLGYSITYDIPIRSLIFSRLQVTVPLAILSMIFALLISIPMGVYSSLHRNRVGDYGVMVFSQMGPSYSPLCRNFALVAGRWISTLANHSHQNVQIPPPSRPFLGSGESCCAHPDDTVLHA